jgi:3-oxoacyl-[acyl-carrier protein] reductase
VSEAGAANPKEERMTNQPVALITGAGRGIGRGIAFELVKEGFAVAGCDIVFQPKNTDAGLFEVKEAITAQGGVFYPVRSDISAIQTHDALLKAVLGRFGRLDVLVNNAGVAPETRQDVLETTPASYDRVMDVNLRGPFFLTQKAARIMAGSREKGTIIFITSISAEASSMSRAEYCVSKAGLSMAARTFADRLAGDGILVYEIRPGIIRTDMTASVREKYDKLIADGLVPQGRWGSPEDVGKAVAALARGAFPYSTGLVLEVSGGMNIRRL